ncbi:MAG: hypothetical protein RL264_999 [Bacteroidota bacterium]|jgi:FKBP-type peptidyl-prolyl cis-trans isomerase FkpA
MSKLIFYFFVVSSLFLAACQTYSDADKDAFDTEIGAFLRKKGIKMKKSSSGMYYKIEQEGEGKNVQYTDSVAMLYKGELMNGKVIDLAKEPRTFAVKELIAGWKEALLLSKKGTKMYIILPPQLAYGDNKLDDIPQHSILQFHLEVVDIK